MVEPAFRILLVNAPAVTAIIGDRCEFNTKRQDERRPCIVLSRVSTATTRRITGGAGLHKGRMQVDCFAPNYQTLKQLTAAVRACLDGYTGTTNGTEFVLIEHEDERDTPSAPLTAQAQPLFAASADYMFIHK